jgi:hypothetical protein
MVLVEEQRTQELHPLEWIRHVAARMAAAKPRRLTSWPQMQAEFRGERLRAVRNSFFDGPRSRRSRTFRSTIFSGFLSDEWFRAETDEPLEQQHIRLFCDFEDRASFGAT